MGSRFWRSLAILKPRQQCAGLFHCMCRTAGLWSAAQKRAPTKRRGQLTLLAACVESDQSPQSHTTAFYSITSSAPLMSEGENSSPRILAAFRLMKSSTFVTS
jgi:hypothetical protein